MARGRGPLSYLSRALTASHAHSCRAFHFIITNDFIARDTVRRYWVIYYVRSIPDVLLYRNDNKSIIILSILEDGTGPVSDNNNNISTTILYGAVNTRATINHFWFGFFFIFFLPPTPPPSECVSYSNLTLQTTAAAARPAWIRTISFGHADAAVSKLLRTVALSS